MPAPIDSDQVREALARILASEGFRSSPRLSRFLQYLVETSLNGSGGSPKEHSIGIEVFDKPESFDPCSDSSVRAEASKLRLKLRLYYETGGRNDPVVIDIPKGGYAAAFQARSGSSVRRSDQKSHRVIFAVIAVIGTIIAVIWWTNRPADRPQPSLTRITNDLGLNVDP